MRPRLTACALVAFATCLFQSRDPGTAAFAADPIAPAATAAPAGTYTLDRNHASLIFRVNHLGFSHYTARFTRFEAKLEFDPADPAASIVTATIDPSSIETDNPDPTLDFDHQLQNRDWLNTAQFPQMTFRSTTLELTGPNTARMTGELGLHGVTHPVSLDVTFNGGYAGHPLDPSGARIGFSAQGSLKRSEFGISEGVPPPGSTFGVSDEVEILIEAEFTRPAPARG
jgi:polyisoprenoid-binding protein YceI